MDAQHEVVDVKGMEDEPLFSTAFQQNVDMNGSSTINGAASVLGPNSEEIEV